jgi:hypothetical protein
MTRPREVSRQLILLSVVPAAIYLAIFVVVTFPLVVQFPTHFFTDEKDGLVMIWNVWWTKTALTELHQSPWHTDFLYHPYGVCLFAHTLSPFNGLLATALLSFLTLKEAYNLVVIFTFVVSGLTTFWLSHFLIRSYWPSIVAGFIFSFSNYHFAHTPGHLNLASLEWMPLFVLCWYVLMRNPSILVALGAAGSLLAVILCDYYYFFYGFFIAVAVFLWRAAVLRDALFFTRKRYLVPLSVFASLTLATTGVIVLKLVRFILSGPLHGAHDPSEFAADLLSPFIYGPCLRFSHLTKGFWSDLHGNTSETGIYMGLSVLILIAFTWLKRKTIQVPGLRLWYALLLIFFVMSLGPALHVWGRHVPFDLMPYRLLGWVFPWLELSGAPTRMMTIVMLCAALMSAAGLELLARGSTKGRVVAVVLVAFLFVEFLPQRLPTFKGEMPEWPRVLGDLPGDGAVIDARGDPYSAMYFQTVHKRPIRGGFVARIPESLMRKNEFIDRLVAERDSERLRDEYGFAYAVTGSGEIYDLSRGAVVYRPK